MGNKYDDFVAFSRKTDLLTDDDITRFEYYYAHKDIVDFIVKMFQEVSERTKDGKFYTYQDYERMATEILLKTGVRNK